MIKKLSIIALILILVGIAGTIITFKSGNISKEFSEEWIIEDVVNANVGITGSISTIESGNISKEFSDEKIIEDFGYTNVEITTDNAEVIVLPTTDDKTKVVVSGNDKNYSLSTDVKDDTLSIGLKIKRVKLVNLDLFSTHLTLKVYVPLDIYESIHVKSINGRINISGIEAKGIFVSAVNGIISLENISSSMITTETSNGITELENVTGQIYSTSKNGKISLITEDLDRPIELETVNGQIEIQTNKEPTNATLDAKVTFGKIRIFGNSDWDIITGNGENRIKLTTVNGNITITK